MLTIVKKAGVAALIAEKLRFRDKEYYREKEGHFITTECQEDINNTKFSCN